MASDSCALFALEAETLLDSASYKWGMPSSAVLCQQFYQLQQLYNNPLAFPEQPYALDRPFAMPEFAVAASATPSFTTPLSQSPSMSDQAAMPPAQAPAQAQALNDQSQRVRPARAPLDSGEDDFDMDAALDCLLGTDFIPDLQRSSSADTMSAVSPSSSQHSAEPANAAAGEAAAYGTLEAGSCFADAAFRDLDLGALFFSVPVPSSTAMGAASSDQNSLGAAARCQPARTSSLKPASPARPARPAGVSKKTASPRKAVSEEALFMCEDASRMLPCADANGSSSWVSEMLDSGCWIDFHPAPCSAC